MIKTKTKQILINGNISVMYNYPLSTVYCALCLRTLKASSTIYCG